MASGVSEDGQALMERALAQIRKEFMPGQRLHSAVDPMTIHNFFPPAFAGNWAIYRESIVVERKFNRKEKEQIAAIISGSNACKFCCAAHGNFAVAANSGGSEMRAAMDTNDPSLLRDERMRKVCTWAKECQKKASPALREAPPFNLDEAPEVIATAFKFNFTNRLVDVFITQSLVPQRLPWFIRLILYMLPFLQRPLIVMMTKWKAEHMKRLGAVKEGEALAILGRDAKPRPEFRWNEKNECIAKVFAYWCWAMDELAEQYIPKEVTNFVGKYIEENYSGEDPPLSRNWVFKVAEETGMREAHQCAIRFMLLLSFARFQIDGGIKGDLKKHFPDYRTQRAMGIWAAHKTAAAIAEWEGESVMRLAT